MKILLPRLLSPRNILPVVVIVAAFVSIFDITLFGLSARPEQIITALLGLLAIDALVERLDLLMSIEQEVQRTNFLLAPKVSANVFLQKQDLRNVGEIIDSTESELWIYGVTLDGLVTLVDKLRQKLLDGCAIHILAPNPKGSAFSETAKFFGSRSDPLAKRLEGNLDILGVRLRGVPNNQVEIRMIDRVISTGFVIVNPSSKNGHLLLRHYRYWFGASGAPIMELFKEREPEWFDLYVDEFSKAWEHATKYLEVKSAEAGVVDAMSPTNQN